jgi:acyl carrier protein
MQNHTEKVRQFIVDSFLFGEAGDLTSDDASFLEEGIIDSTGVLELVTFLEEEFGIKIEDEDLIPDNLDSVNKVASFVACKSSPVTEAAG